jgi:AcrR family transcriptional regulator
MNDRSPQKRLRPRKTPSQPRSEETVASIIEAAAQILEAQGFDGFNTNAVAARAGVSIGSLYQYFPGKDALTVALIRREMTRFHEDISVALTKRSGKAGLEYLIGAAVRQQLQRPRLARLLDIEEGRPALRDELATSELEQMATEVIKRAIPGTPIPKLRQATCSPLSGASSMRLASGARPISRTSSIACGRLCSVICRRRAHLECTAKHARM